MQSLGINASGRTSASLKTKVTIKGVQLTSEGAPISTLEKGVSPQDASKCSALYYILQDWADDKGLSFESDKEKKVFCYFLSQKIKRNGTIRYEQNVDVYSSAVKDTIPKITSRLKDAFISKLKSLFN